MASIRSHTHRVPEKPPYRQVELKGSVDAVQTLPGPELAFRGHFELLVQADGLEDQLCVLAGVRVSGLELEDEGLREEKEHFFKLPMGANFA